MKTYLSPEIAEEDIKSEANQLNLFLTVSWSGSSTTIPSVSQLELELFCPSLLFITRREMLASLISSLLSSSAVNIDKVAQGLEN